MNLAFENLSEKFTSIFKKLRSRGKLSENDVRSVMREVRMALLEADVNYKIAKDFTDSIINKAIGQKVMESLTPAQMVINIVNEELIRLMGDNQSKLNFPSKQPCVIMLCGLQGSGKTTQAAKLSYLLKKNGHRPLLVACDVYRPAAVKQLQILGQKIGTSVFSEDITDPIKIAKDALSHAKDYGNDVVILDTAGRLHIDDGLMDELKQINNFVKPNEILLVVDAMIGQDSVNMAKAFNEILEITGVILTKLDGDTRGGAALSIKAVTHKPIKYVGTGEKIEDLQIFYPDRMASRILGMGDVLSLIDDAKEKYDKKQAEKLVEKLEKNKFDLDDLAEQLKKIRNMGPIKNLLGKLPGIASKIKDMDFDDKVLDRLCAIIYSMTKKERQDPSIINASRKKRIAVGSGNKVEDVNKLLRQFESMRKVIKQFNGKGKGLFSKFKFPKFIR